MKLFSLPNLFTLGNLFCGCLGIVFAFQGDLVWAAYLVGIAAVLDFLDGFVARIMNVHSPLGKQLDSLADMTTFGVLPGVMMFQLMNLSITGGRSLDYQWLYPHADQFGSLWVHHNQPPNAWPCYAAFLLTLFSALRLAKFNVDTRQTDSFIGVPTPANTILIASFPLILMFGYEQEVFRYVVQQQTLSDAGRYIAADARAAADGMSYAALQEVPLIVKMLLNYWFLFGVTVIMSFLLIAELPLFALKFKSFGWKGNEIRYIFLALSVALIALLQFTGIPLVIVLYILLSVVDNLLNKKSPPQAAQ